MSTQPDTSLKLACNCVGTCAILSISFDNLGYEDQEAQKWLWEFYTNSGYEHSFRHRLRIAWSVIRGKEHFFHGTVHSVDDMEQLHEFLANTLPEDATHSEQDDGNQPEGDMPS